MALTLVRAKPQFDVLFARVSETLLRFQREVVTSGARFLVMIIPDEYQVDAKLRAAVISRMGRRPSDFDFDRPQRRLRQFLDAHDIEYVDLLEAFQSRGGRQPLYRLRDTHWNAAGNQLAAEQLLSVWSAGGPEAEIFTKMPSSRSFD